MRKTLLRYVIPSLLVLVALAADLAYPPVGRPLLVASALVGLLPLAGQVAAEFRKNKRIDLGLPVVLTIVILLAFGQLKTAAIFVLLILLGGLFKDYIVWKVQRSVEGIAQALPDTALVRAGGGTREAKIADIARGDIVILKAGSRVPVDGTLLTESASFDESVVTGESRPVPKKKGDALVAGAIDLSEYAEMEASGTSATSTIAQVKKLVAEAQSRSAPLSKFTTRYAEATVVVTIVLCVVLFIATRDVLQALALWIALVPVVFAIIVPVSTTLGISLLARRGVLIKNAEAVENLTKIDTIVFDKTGTLTKGDAEVVGIASAGAMDAPEALRLAAGLETFSEHHLGDAIVKKAARDGVAPAEISSPRSVKGRGIEGVHEGRRVLAGNRAFMDEAGVTLPEAVIADAAAREAQGATAVFFAVGAEVAAMFFIEDALRENARSAVAELRRMGFSLIMLTGDSEPVARKIAGELGIEEVRSRCLPQDKIARIAELKAAGRKVAMIGDGINDAPALAEAHVGIAMGLRGVDVTLESAQAVLVSDDLAALPEVIRASRRIFRTITNDLVIATAIHAVTAAFVVAGTIGVLGSTLLHQASSALVLGNTLTLFRLGKAERRRSA
ncbi:MAG TPA: cation-translocating P-type ATPase [Candidatus Binatia bacterium]|nr:cation-translocating P-type ATPase [Candidatus Binatia bacterium]